MRKIVGLTDEEMHSIAVLVLKQNRIVQKQLYQNITYNWAGLENFIMLEGFLCEGLIHRLKNQFDMHLTLPEWQALVGGETKEEIVQVLSTELRGLLGDFLAAHNDTLKTEDVREYSEDISYVSQRRFSGFSGFSGFFRKEKRDIDNPTLKISLLEGYCRGEVLFR